MNSIIVDLEMNPISREFTPKVKTCGSETIEIGAVMLDERYKEITTFKKYVKPQCSSSIMSRVEDITGISMALVNTGEKFSEAFNSFLSWCNSYGQDYHIYSWSLSDLVQLKSDMKLNSIAETSYTKYMLKNWSDFQLLFRKRLRLSNTPSLEKALAKCGIDFQGKAHDAFWDSKNTAELFRLYKEGNKLIEAWNMVNDVVNNDERLKVSLGSLFDFSKIQFTD